MELTYTYRATGQRATMSDGTGATQYQYDVLDRLITSTTGAGAAVGYGYDAADNQTRLTYPDGSVITRTFDAANRQSGDRLAGARP